jgi:ATP-dependent DNA helicase RecG
MAQFTEFIAANGQFRGPVSAREFLDCLPMLRRCSCLTDLKWRRPRIGDVDNHYIDLKAVEADPANLSEAVSAFSNTAGGELFIGIDEKTVAGKKVRTWRGFKDVEAANDRIATIERMSPLGNHYRAEFLTCNDEAGALLHLTIFKSKDILKASNGVVYVRRGAQKQSVRSEEALHRLQLDKGIVSFEDETFNTVSIFSFAGLGSELPFH